MRHLALRLLVVGLCLLHPAASARSQNGTVETFEIGLSTERIGITSDFSGARLVVFGVLDNADARILRQQRYDIVVILEGPRRPLVIREKERTLGLWVNSGSERFNAAPSSYALASTRPLGDIAPRPLLTRLSVGIDNLRLNVGEEEEPDTVDGEADVAVDPDRDEYAEALRRIRRAEGLYNQTSGTIRFVSQTLFRADLTLPADLPVGQHTARAYLFRQGVFIREDSESLLVVKTGFESFISNFSARYSFLYGVLAVVLALFTGWFGRIAFKRD